MALESTRANKVGNVVKYEQALDHGFAREAVTATLTPTSIVGDVYANVAGTWALVTALTTGNELGVLVEANAEGLRPATGTANVTVTMLKSNSIVVLEQLNFGADIDTQSEIDAVIAQLESQGIKVRTQV